MILVWKNFQYQVYKNLWDGDLDVTLNQNGEFLLQEGNDIYINISDYISENDYLDKMTNDWGSYSLGGYYTGKIVIIV